MSTPQAPRIADVLKDTTTDRLRLSRMSAGDVAALTPVFAEPAVWRFPYGRGMDAAWTAGFVIRAVEHRQRFGFGLWTARTRPDDTVIGYLELTEVCSAPQNLNPPSARVARRIGMRYERTAGLAPTTARDAVEVDLYRITRQDWLADD